MDEHPESENGRNKFEDDLTKYSGEFRRKPSKYERRRNFIKEYLIDFSANSNLHGLKYIGDKECSCVEKLFWLFMFILCVVLCAGLIKNVWRKWNDTPVIVSFAEKPMPIWQIPYPAVTVCFETKAMQRQFNFTEYYHLYYNNDSYNNLTVKERQLFEDVSEVCDDDLTPPGTTRIVYSARGHKFSSGLNTVKNIKQVSPNLTEVFLSCKWKDSADKDCTELFLPVLTEEGQCYTFNTLGAEDLFRTDNLHTDFRYLENHKKAQSWTLEQGYDVISKSLKTYPERGLGYGVKSGLSFLLKAHEEDLDFICKGAMQGFKILLHNPAELPRVSQRYFRAPLSQEVVVAVKPTMMTTSQGLRSYNPVRRQCYFPTERYLRYFKIYTQSNCEMECLSNFTNVRCGCVHFGMPRGPDTNVCSTASRECLKKAQMELVTIEIQSRLDQAANDSVSDDLRKAREVAAICQCLQSCASIEYAAETSQADYDWQALYKANRINFTEGDGDEKWYLSHVMIFFKEAQFIPSRRSELYGQTDFLANCGGLLGLFMGFSILSLVEIVYYLTLRLSCMYISWRNQKIKRQSTLKM